MFCQISSHCYLGSHKVVLVPALFTVYTKPLGTIAQSFGVKHQLYADDAHLFVSLELENKADFSSALQNLRLLLISTF